MEKIFDAAKKIQSDESRDPVLVAISQFDAKHKQWRKAHQRIICNAKTCQVNMLSAILTVKAEQDHPELIEKEEPTDTESP